MIKQKFITFHNENGNLENVAIIHYVHSDDDLTIEYLDWIDVELLIMREGCPSFDKKDILSEKCADINLSEQREVKLHYTWHTVIAEYVRSYKKRRTIKISPIQPGGVDIGQA